MPSLLQRLHELSPEVAATIQAEFGGQRLYIQRSHPAGRGVAIEVVGRFRQDLPISIAVQRLPRTLQGLDAAGLAIETLRVSEVGLGIGYLEQLRALPELAGLAITALPAR